MVLECCFWVWQWQLPCSTAAVLLISCVFCSSWELAELTWQHRPGMRATLRKLTTTSGGCDHCRIGMQKSYTLAGPLVQGTQCAGSCRGHMRSNQERIECCLANAWLPGTQPLQNMCTDYLSLIEVPAKAAAHTVCCVTSAPYLKNWVAQVHEGRFRQ